MDRKLPDQIKEDLCVVGRLNFYEEGLSTGYGICNITDIVNKIVEDKEILLNVFHVYYAQKESDPFQKALSKKEMVLTAPQKKI